MDKALKQRLVGASVLIALAVIVLPMLFGGRPEGASTEPQKIELPSQPSELNFETRRYPIGEPAEQGARNPGSTGDGERVSQLPTPKIPVKSEMPNEEVSSEAAEESGVEVTGLGVAPGETESPESTQNDTEAPVAAVSTATEQQETDREVVSRTPVTPAGRYVVQVASFGAADNANRLSGRLADSGYSVLTDTVKSEVGTLHRVRVGPYDSEAEAKKAVVALSSSIKGVKPRVMDLQPEQAAQVTTPEDPLVRWVVQVGSFSSADNAENVVASLRLKGMSAYQETVSTANSQIFRVRVGPFLNRDEALTTEHEISESLSLNAVVMTMD